MPLLFNTLSIFVIAFIPRSKPLLISWLQSPPAVILDPPKIKSVTVSPVSPSIYHEVMGPDAMILEIDSGIRSDRQNGDCSHEIKRCLLSWKKSYDSILKSRDNYFANKGPSSQGYGFSCGHVWM